MARQKNQEVSAEEYYEPCLKGHRSLRNNSARKIWFEDTEPEGERPTHTKVLHVRKAEHCMQRFMANLAAAVVKNASLRFPRNPQKPLPARDSKWQSLAEAPEPPSTFLP